MEAWVQDFGGFRVQALGFRVRALNTKESLIPQPQSQKQLPRCSLNEAKLHAGRPLDTAYQPKGSGGGRSGVKGRNHAKRVF